MMNKSVILSTVCLLFGVAIRTTVQESYKHDKGSQWEPVIS